jgi:F-type H+-transporting ATPase subunit gamma
MSQTLSVLQLLPVIWQGARKPAGQTDYIYEQSPLEMLERLMPRYVEVAVFPRHARNGGAYQAARMTAMDKASSNAKEVIDR